MNDYPFWSIMIPSYNCARYLQKTLESVLQQDIGESSMQIEVIDDCSTDNPEQVVNEIGKGRVSFFKQKTNVGHIRNFQSAIGRAKGQVIHLLHGDDFVLPGFYKTMQEMYSIFPEMGACFSRHFYVDEDDQITSISSLIVKHDGIIKDFLFRQLCNQQVQTPSITVKRSVYQHLGGFNPALTWAEDWEMWARIGSKYPVGFIKEPLACYRMHQQSSSGKKLTTAENVEDLIRLKEILLTHAKENEIQAITKSLNNVIFQRALGNYNHVQDKNSAARNMLFMAKYASSRIAGLRLYLKYLLLRIWVFKHVVVSLLKNEN